MEKLTKQEENKPYKLISKKYVYELIEKYPNDFDLGGKLRVNNSWLIYNKKEKNTSILLCFIFFHIFIQKIKR